MAATKSDAPALKGGGAQAAPPVAGEAGPRLSGKEARKANAKLREERNRKLGPLQKAISEMEREISDLESKKAALETALMDPALYSDQNAFADKSSQHKKTADRLQKLYPKWEAQQEELEQLEQAFSEVQE